MFRFCRIKCSELLNLSCNNAAPWLGLFPFFAHGSQSSLFSPIRKDNRPVELRHEALSLKRYEVLKQKRGVCFCGHVGYLYWLPTSGPCPNTCLGSWLDQKISKSCLKLISLGSYSTCSSNSNGKTNIIFNHLPKSDFFFNLLDEFIPENNSIPMLQTQHLKSKLNKRSTSIFPHNYRQKFYFFLNSIKGQKFFIIKEVKENKKKGMKRNNGPIQTRHGRPSFCIRGWFWIHQRKQQ